ncbi:hypothetical protein HOLleu_35737 [Holothuria leucospilota]|uniref:CCHC-type domain-containing protein n=1 Tax=Holothuria leucospilota TaxID=206669 RepID=A0A9Q1BFK7_HOLLE|nr:hypothetical protein HOLleu_35737 [Holothuria leucospilota]
MESPDQTPYQNVEVIDIDPQSRKRAASPTLEQELGRKMHHGDPEHYDENAESNRPPPSNKVQYPVILSGLQPNMKHPISIRHYIEQCHPTAAVILARPTASGALLIAAQDLKSQKILMKPWQPIAGKLPTPRIPGPRREQPNNNKYEAVIIRIHPSVIDTEVYHELQQQGYSATNFRRFYRKGTSTPIWKAAITFATEENYNRALMDGIFIGYEHHVVQTLQRPPTPLQCFKCQRFGHLAAHCTHTQTCLCCAGNHTLADCDKPKEEPKCANCQEAHIASYKGCTKYKREVSNIQEKHEPVTKAETISRKTHQANIRKIKDTHHQELNELKENHRRDLEEAKIQQVEADKETFHKII